MNSRFWPEVRAVFRKELRAELRAKQGLFTATLFSVVSVVTVAFANAERRPEPTQSAGLLSLVLLFSACITLPRLFLAEDEQRTLDLLRLLCPPESAFWGKFLFAFAQLILTSAALAGLFVALTSVPVANAGALFTGLVLESLTLASAMAVTGVLVTGASQRWLLGSVVSMPLLLPQVSLSIGVLRYGFGEGEAISAQQNMVGLFLFGIALLSFGPVLARMMWRLEPSGGNGSA